jgi:hypothetical protein
MRWSVEFSTELLKGLDRVPLYAGKTPVLLDEVVAFADGFVEFATGVGVAVAV